MITIITTIAPPTASVLSLFDKLRQNNCDLIIIGDKKGPVSYDLPDTQFYSLQRQLDLPFSLARLLPEGHYARKNLGYLIAIADKSECIYETDDDNAPDDHWRVRHCDIKAIPIKNQRWTNVYRYFTEELVWPRGFPLEYICENNESFHDLEKAAPEPVEALIQQGLVNEAPDVDAVWRLIFKKSIYFQRYASIYLHPGSWCPFNSQNTWWWPDSYPLLYLPSLCSFRMTDIWRSFIAQRCLWAMGKVLAFHGPDAVQHRNVHNIKKDFDAEIVGYTGNDKFVKNLEVLKLDSGKDCVTDNLLTCYEALVREGFFPEKELALVQAWIADLNDLNKDQTLAPESIDEDRGT